MLAGWLTEWFRSISSTRSVLKPLRLAVVQVPHDLLPGEVGDQEPGRVALYQEGPALGIHQVALARLHAQREARCNAARITVTVADRLRSPPAPEQVRL